MEIAIGGASGFIGSHLSRALAGRGHRVRPLLRPSTPPHPAGIRWDPDGGTIDDAAIGEADAVVNLAGTSIGASRWTERQKTAMRASRIRSTSLLARTLSSLDAKPRVFVAASASGYYGSRGAETLDERAAPGTGFLAELCVEWERVAASSGVRTVMLRSGIVLGSDGGLLPKMLPVFRMGLGGTLGDGSQWMPWISIEDEVRAIVALLESEDAEGPYNMVAPQTITNAQFTRALGDALHRPAKLRVPAFALRTVFGDEATDEAFLSSQKMLPARLDQMGFRFQDADVAAALRDIVA